MLGISPMQPDIRDMLASVEKPFRYIGGEVGARRKKWNEAKVRLCLAFPDIYEIGMSNVGLSILYHIINKQDDMLAERVFTPWPDMEKEMARRGLPLFSLESQRPLTDFDIVGISLPYELSYTNILTILSAASLPWLAKDRGPKYPLIIGGGPGAFNPLPVADFFDAVVMGDGEEVLPQIMEWVKEQKDSGRSKEELLERLSQMDGIYVPSLNNQVKKAFVKDIENAPYPERPVVPYAAVHDRVGIEVSRGCTRGCRFCQAGFIYRPVRMRTAQTATALAVNQLKNCGHEELSFLSLSLGDYPDLNGLLRSVNDCWRGPPINSQLPSLRVEALSDETLQLLGRARHGSFTLAPEAATERMRRVINKGNTDADLYVSVEKVFALGWHQVKLYFMIGLPGETQEDLEGIVDMAHRCLNIGKRYHSRAEVTVSTSTFVPKPHTPLQWAGQISIEETIDKQAYLKKHLRRKGLYYRWHDAHMSFLEGILSRGDKRLSSVIAKAHSLGARFDAWDEKFDLAIWRQAFEQYGIDQEEFLIPRDKDHEFAWDHLYTDLNKKYLWKEYERACKGEPTPDCAQDKCQGCGVCDSSLVVGRSSIVRTNTLSETLDERLTTNDERRRYRIKFAKLDGAAFLGHHELINVLKYAFRRARLPLSYSAGYHPRPRMSFGKALGLGMESECEYCDIEMMAPMAAKVIGQSLEGVFPQGINVLSVEEIAFDTPSIDQSVAASTFEVSGFSRIGRDEKQLAGVIEGFAAVKAVQLVRQRGPKTLNVDLKDYVSALAVLHQDAIRLTLHEIVPSVKIGEAIERVFDLNENDQRKLLIKKVGVEFKCQMNLS